MLRKVFNFQNKITLMTKHNHDIMFGMFTY